jgi:hypothetical protein
MNHALVKACYAENSLYTLHFFEERSNIKIVKFIEFFDLCDAMIL